MTEIRASAYEKTVCATFACKGFAAILSVGTDACVSEQCVACYSGLSTLLLFDRQDCGSA
jgi:hypothetical protein